LKEKVLLISLGGTIASTNKGSSKPGVTPKLTADDLVSSIPELDNVAEVSTMSFRQLPSPDLTIHDMVELVKEIKKQINQGYKGIVITQGTDNIEETVFTLDCLLDVEIPVIITGAMRNPDLPSADGAANILTAVQTAVSDDSHGLGTLVVFNDEIHSAQFVKKTHTSSTAAFHSPLTGPIGWISEGVPQIVLHPRKRWYIDTVNDDHSYCPVALVKLGFDDDGALLDFILTSNYQGLVIEGLGGGHAPSKLVDKIEKISERIPVILASRTGNGEVLRQTYSFPGSETDLLGKGLINAGFLDGLKARILLMLLLMSGADHTEIRKAFSTNENLVL